MRKRLSTLRRKLMHISELYHGLFHVLFGVFAFILGYYIEPEFFADNYLRLFTLSMVGSFLPDIDHVFYIYGYGRKSIHAVTSRVFLKNRDIRGFLSFAKSNHKHNTGLYSHNIGSMLLAFFFTFYELQKRDNVFMSMFFLAWTFHYLYDIMEDILFFKKPNKNWFFLFNRK